MLGSVFGSLTSPAAISPSTTSILHLSLGPLDLNLLGLNVHLDNCSGHEITVDVTAQTGPGNLPGNLVSALAHLLDSNTTNPAVLSRLQQILTEIQSLG